MFVNRSEHNEQLYRGPSIDASYQVSVHLAKGFQRRLKYEKLMDDERQVIDDGPLILLIKKDFEKNKIWGDLKKDFRWFNHILHFQI